MARHLLAGAVLASLLSGSLARAQELTIESTPPPPLGFGAAAADLWLEGAAAFAIVTYTGIRDWKWGTAAFRVESEGWFGADTGSGGMDKLGHLYGAYLITDLFAWRLRLRYGDAARGNLYPAAFATALLLYIELFDGYSVDHGWAHEDVLMNTVGTLLSLLRDAVEGLDALVDLRFEYLPSEGTGFHPIIDYSGQKYFGVLKLAGIPLLAHTPLRLAELHVGYYTRGFRKGDQGFDDRRTSLFVGVGLSLDQLVFAPLEHHVGTPGTYLRAAGRYLQVPYSYIPADVRQRHYPR